MCPGNDRRQMFHFTKILISALLIWAISEIAKRCTFWGAVIASIPLTSVVAFVWIYAETKNIEKISRLSHSVFWLVIPSLVLFLALPLLLKKIHFLLALPISIILTAACYFLMINILKHFGVQI